MLLKQKIKYVFILLGIIIIPLFLIGDVFAESTPEAGVQVSPIRFDWKLDSGEKKEYTIILHNFSDVTHNIEVEVEDFYVSDDSKQANFFVPDADHPRKAYDVINWIDVPKNFVLKPGETKRVNFTVTVPENQPTSGYYGTIFFKTSSDDVEVKDKNDGNVKLDVNYRVGVLLTLAVQGEDEMNIGGEVKDFDVTNTIFWNSPIEVFARLHSTGNVHYKVSGYIRVDKFDKKFAIIKIDEEIMYPNKDRLFEEKINFGPWDFGIYSAKLDMHSEDGSVIFQEEVPAFLVIPWKTLFGLIMGLLIIIFGGIWFNKKFTIIKKQENKN
jgi:hypothetical protein